METFFSGTRFKSTKEMSNQNQAKHIKIENIGTRTKNNDALDKRVMEETTTASVFNAMPNNKFVLKGQPLQIFTQEKIISGPKSGVAKPVSSSIIAQSLNAFTINPAGPTKPPSVNFQNNITLSPVKGGFKIPISPLKNFKNPLRLSIISNPNANASKSVNIEASTSGTNRLSTQNTSNFQFQTLIPPQTNRIAHTDPQGTTQAINIQPQLSGGRFQCLRLVQAANPQHSTANVGIPIANLIPAQQTSTPVRASIVQQQPQPIQQYLNVPTVQKPLGQPPAKTQRLIMPATPQNQPASSNLSPGSVLQAGNVGYAMVPAKYVEQLKKQLNNQLLQVLKSESTVAVATDTSTTTTAIAKSVANGKVRKPCNCTKSMCLKLYCECFANGHFCDGCNCINCHNNVEFDTDRSKAIKSCLERNPLAFKPKIGRGGDDNRTHQKGCNCKRSGCLKNYCECYEARIPCTSKCKCIGCKNIEEDGTANSEQRSLMNLADAAAVRCQQQAAARSRINSQLKDMRSSRSKSHSQTSSGERLPCMFFTQEVIEATCTCLLAQAEEAEKTNRSIQVAETMILEEFGRCLMQIIQAASKTKAPAQSF